MPYLGSAVLCPARRVRRWLWGPRFRQRLVAVALGTALGAPLAAQPATGIDLQPATRQSLARIQEQWLQWVSAFYQNDATRARAVADQLIAGAEQLGMKRLPDLCVGVLTRAVASAREGNFERSRWALEQAERFDPGRPETRFAAAAVARREGAYLKAFGHSLAALPRVRNHPTLARLTVARSAIWFGGVLVLAAGLFLVLQLAAKGSWLWRDTTAGMPSALPAWALAPATLFALLWPLLLPMGAVWLGLYLSILLWSYGSVSERCAWGLGWVLVAAVPLGVAALERRVLVDLQPPARALDHVSSRRLAGDLFTDLEALQSVLPESIAVQHLLADVNRNLGQWEAARAGYLRVIAAEPDKPAAALALGAYYFRKGDFGRAVEYFNRAATADPRNAEARYDLSLAYSEKYLFTEARLALNEARRLNEPRVASWIRQQSPDKIVLIDGGIDRAGEIRDELQAAHRGTAVGRRLRLRRLLPIPLVLVTALAAVALHRIRHRREGAPEARAHEIRDDAAPAAPAAGDPAGTPRWLPAALLGWRSARAGRGFAAAGAALVIAVIVTIPLLERMTFVMPWRFDPGRLAAWAVTVSLALTVAAYRYWSWRRES